MYYVAFPKDPSPLKWIVICLLLLETVQTMMWTQDTVEAFTVTFTDAAVFNVVRTVWFTIPFLTGVSTYKFICLTLVAVLLTKLV